MFTLKVRLASDRETDDYYNVVKKHLGGYKVDTPTEHVL